VSDGVFGSEMDCPAGEPAALLYARLDKPPDERTLDWVSGAGWFVIRHEEPLARRARVGRQS